MALDQVFAQSSPGAQAEMLRLLADRAERKAAEHRATAGGAATSGVPKRALGNRNGMFYKIYSYIRQSTTPVILQNDIVI